MEDFIHFTTKLIITYLGMGVLAYLAMIFKGLNDIDPATRETSFWFKLLILPGILVFWPWLLIKWYSKTKGE